jgi:hypothetical protein
MFATENYIKRTKLLGGQPCSLIRLLTNKNMSTLSTKICKSISVGLSDFDGWYCMRVDKRDRC